MRIAGPDSWHASCIFGSCVGAHWFFHPSVLVPHTSHFFASSDTPSQFTRPTQRTPNLRTSAYFDNMSAMSTSASGTHSEMFNEDPLVVVASYNRYADMWLTRVKAGYPIGPLPCSVLVSCQCLLYCSISGVLGPAPPRSSAARPIALRFFCWKTEANSMPLQCGEVCPSFAGSKPCNPLRCAGSTTWRTSRAVLPPTLTPSGPTACTRELERLRCSRSTTRSKTQPSCASTPSTMSCTPVLRTSREITR